MSTKLIDDDTNKKLVALAENSISNVDDLLQKISNYNEKFNINDQTKYENNLVLERYPNLDVSDESIQKQAENELSEYKNSSINKIEQDKITKENELLQNKDTLQKNYSNSKDEVTGYYDNARQNTSDDALKRGLARSSIVINKIDAFNNQEIDMYNTLNKELTDSVNQIDFELSSLEAQTQLALSEFDITYASKLSTKITSLKEELIEKQNEITKYNNQIAEKEASWELKINQLNEDLNNTSWDKELDMLNIYNKYGGNAIEKYRQSQIYKMVNEYLSEIDKTEAKNILQNNEQLKGYLTTDNLNKLLNLYS